VKFDLFLFCSKHEINHYVGELKRESVEWLKQFKNLNSAIVSAVEL
jgi:hypothetical protein